MKRQQTQVLGALNRRELLRSAMLGTAGVGLVGSSAAAAGRRSAPTDGECSTPEPDDRASVSDDHATVSVSRAIHDADDRREAWVELKTAHLTHNLAAARARAGDRPVMGVIKANGYGHGVVQIGGALAAAGIDALMVINLAEALALRQAGVQVPIMNFGPIDAQDAAVLMEHRIQQIVYDRETIRTLALAAKRQQTTAEVHVHVDTGIGRVGVPFRRAAAVFEEAAAHSPLLKVVGSCTTFTEDGDFDREQLARFRSVCDQASRSGFDPGRRHAASSAGVLGLPESHLDMVRPGILLYGHYPSEAARQREARRIGLRPVLSLRCRVAYVKELQKGDSVGYGRPYISAARETVATLPVGHSDGYPTQAATNGGFVGIRGTRCPLVGSVTSNHCVARVPQGLRVVPGDVATLIEGSVTELGGSESAPRNDGQRAGQDRSGGSVSSTAPASSAAPDARTVAAWMGDSVYRVHIQLSPLLPKRIV